MPGAVHGAVHGARWDASVCGSSGAVGMSMERLQGRRRIVHGDLTPAMAQLLARIARAPGAPFHEGTAHQARAAYERAAEVLDLPRLALADVRDIELPRRDGTVCRARRYSTLQDAALHEPAPYDPAPYEPAPHARPAAAGLQPVLLYLHGGGFTVGSLETHDSLCRQLAARSGAAVVALDYRLAPEHRFPAAVDDAFDALAALCREGARWGLDGTRVAVGGDSAGGTLAAVAALMARDAGLRLALQLLITPGTTAHADTDSHRRYAQGYLLEARTIEWFFGHYIDPEQRSDWRFAPLNADSLEGAAPAAVLLAECDPLMDEGLAYADRLRMAGVSVELELVRGVVHDFIKMGRALREADAAQQWCAQALGQALDVNAKETR